MISPFSAWRLIFLFISSREWRILIFDSSASFLAIFISSCLRSLDRGGRFILIKLPSVLALTFKLEDSIALAMAETAPLSQAEIWIVVGGITPIEPNCLTVNFWPKYSTPISSINFGFGRPPLIPAICSLKCLMISESFNCKSCINIKKDYHKNEIKEAINEFDDKEEMIWFQFPERKYRTEPQITVKTIIAPPLLPLPPLSSLIF